MHPTLYGTIKDADSVCPTPLTQDYVGEVVMVDAGVENGTSISKAVDVRAVVTLRRWNVRFWARTRINMIASRADVVADRLGAAARRRPNSRGRAVRYAAVRGDGHGAVATGTYNGTRGSNGAARASSRASRRTWLPGRRRHPCLIYSANRNVEVVGTHAVTPFDGARVGWGTFREGAAGEQACSARSAR